MDHYRVIYENNLLLRNEYDYENGKNTFQRLQIVLVGLWSFYKWFNLYVSLKTQIMLCNFSLKWHIC